MLAFVGSPLTEHLAHTPEGYLICRSVPIARTAVTKPQKYKGSETGVANCDELFDVYRMPEEVFARRAMASGEGKPISSTKGREKGNWWVSVNRFRPMGISVGTSPAIFGNWFRRLINLANIGTDPELVAGIGRVLPERVVELRVSRPDHGPPQFPVLLL